MDEGKEMELMEEYEFYKNEGFICNNCGKTKKYQCEEEYGYCKTCYKKEIGKEWPGDAEII